MKRCRQWWLSLALLGGGGVVLADETVDRRDVAALLDGLHAAAARSDDGAYFAAYAKDAVFLGTDIGERWTMAQFRAYADPLFARGKGWVYTVRARHLNFADLPCRCVVWFDEVLDSASYGTSRGTGVVVRKTDGWRIEQYALTFPIPNELAADLTTRIKEFEHRAASP